MNADPPATVDIVVVTVDDLHRARYDAEVRRAALLTGSRTVAHDIVADAFVDLIGRWDDVRDPAAYLSRSVLHGARRSGRRRRREEPRDRLDHWSTEDHPDELTDALDALPWKQKAVVVLRYYEARTENEIADELGIRPGSVGPTLHRALRKLRGALSPTPEVSR